MQISKAVNLQGTIYDENNEAIATFMTHLLGDGATPDIQVYGNGMKQVIGYKDDGSVILSKNIDELIESEKVKFMAEAIKQQKALCVENGVDPDLVNILNSEKDKKIDVTKEI